MFQIDHISKAFGGRVLFEDITWQINPGERIGFVGANGTGKTTLCRILAGQEPPDDGRLVMPSVYTIGYLPQEMAIEGESSVLSVVLEGRGDLLKLESEMAHLTQEMAAPGAAHESLSAQYAKVEERYVALDGYAARSSARAILAGMGFEMSAFDRPIHTFSGGWQMRAFLSKLLFQSPDLLLMDEPTNHLDLPSLEWLESFLKGYRGSVVIISHDRYFLNRMVTIIADLSNRGVTLYKGGYDDFLVQRQERLELLTKQATKQRKEIEHMEDFVRRFKAKATKAKQAQSRVKALSKIERIEVPTNKTRNVVFNFPQPPRSGQEVMRLDHVGKSYGEHVVYSGLDFRVERGERVALVGPNGAGKSTLLKILAESIDFEGERLEGYNVSINFFAQHQVEALDMKATVLEEMEREAPADIVGQVRGILGAFLFSGDAVEKKISVLSGGEKSRLALAKMLLRPANLLLLDEPTNHLDIQSRDVLESALKRFSGTLCFISHDRHFINALATRVVHVEHGRIENYPGDYEYYHWKLKQIALEKVPEEVEDETPLEVADHTAEGKKARKRREAELRREKAAAMGNLKTLLTKAEEDVAACEIEHETLQSRMADPALYEGSADEIQQVTRRASEVEARLASLYQGWEELAAKVEEVEETFADVT